MGVISRVAAHFCMSLCAARLVPAALLLVAGCSDEKLAWSTSGAVGQIKRDADALDKLIPQHASVEKLAEGSLWAEGPVWVDEGKYLLFSDVPANRIYRWSQEGGVSLFLQPSGYSGPDESHLREAGSNGLIPGPTGTILMADSGSRAIAKLDLRTKAKSLLITHYNGKRLNSPNDLVVGPNGSIFFTDPPYGLLDFDSSQAKEQARNGVYRLDPTGTLTLLDDSLSRPNGIGVSPDGRTLYVGNSDEKQPIWLAYSLDGNGDVTSRKIFADSSSDIAQGVEGVPDGLCIDIHGNIFASGPGGLIVFSPEGVRLGRIDLGRLVSNCTFGGDGSTLFITADSTLVRVKTLTRGHSP